MPPPRVGFFSDPRCVEHRMPTYHPERPDRIRAVHRAVRTAGLIDSPDPFPEFKIDFDFPEVAKNKLIEFPIAPATIDQLRLVHPMEAIEFIRRGCEAGGVLDHGDTPVTSCSFDAALLSAGSAIAACDAVLRGDVLRAFSAMRPPGHHAEPTRPMGFCLFANLSIAARYAQQNFGVEKIAIVDFDVHHGNGTQAVFEADPSVLFISLHQHPLTCFPGSGYAHETGVGAGNGFTLNIPLEPGTDDEKYLAAIDLMVLPKIDAVKPELLMISAGFDAHLEDPLASLRISDDGFSQITRRLMAVANAHCDGKVVSVLEGGYNLHALGRGVVRHLIAMSESL